MPKGLDVAQPDQRRREFSRWFAPRSKNPSTLQPSRGGRPGLHFDAYYKVGSVSLKVTPDNRGYDGSGAARCWRFTGPRRSATTVTCTLFSGRNEPDARFRCVELKTGQNWCGSRRKLGSAFHKQPPVLVGAQPSWPTGSFDRLGEGGLLGLFRMNPEATRGTFALADCRNCIIPAGRAGAFRADGSTCAAKDRLVCWISPADQ